jgi:hypothetical protein
MVVTFILNLGGTCRTIGVRRNIVIDAMRAMMSIESKKLYIELFTRATVFCIA